MKIRLLNNLPIDNLNEETDHLGIIAKGNLIKLFIENNVDQFNELKMFALYGDWGSGKSTLMKFLQKKLNSTFNTYFFETWEYETDENLSLSLLEYLVSESKSVEDDLLEEFINTAEKLLKGFSKSVRVTLPGLSIDGKILTETLETQKEQTFIELKNTFKTEFRKFEDKISSNTKKQFNIVFIDDLDRCEPINVLNLLSALKLFFTYGERTIFICGIDKKAVRDAVKTKYSDVVKANEYLEKVFDLSFSMPAIFHFDRLILNYFPNIEIDYENDLGLWSEEIEFFFKEINFINPRKVKKVLNKYQIYKSFCVSLKAEGYSVPNIFIDSKNKGNFFETILSIYFIILSEFHPEISQNLFNFKLKKDNCVKAIEATKTLLEGTMLTNINKITNCLNANSSESPLNTINLINANRENFLICFLPSGLKQISYNSIKSPNHFHEIIPIDNTIDYFFYKFLFENLPELFKNKNFSNLSLSGIKDFISRIL